MDLKKLSKSFCWRPFVELDIDREGNIRPCCEFPSSKKWESFEDTHLDVRNSILANEFHRGCKSCWDEEASGFKKSDRLSFCGPKDKNAVLENKFVLKSIILSVDNICNLACTICNKYLSSKWASEEKRMYGTKTVKSTFQDLSKYKNHNVWNDVELLSIYGGEPFYSPNALNLLKWLVNEGISEKITLCFYTNGTIVNNEMISMFNKFKLVRLVVSIDGINDRFNLMRWPASWEEVKNNFQVLSTVPNVELAVHYVYSLLNAYHLVEDLTVIRKDLTDTISIEVLRNPDYYAANHLPIDVKEKLIRDYQSDKDAVTLIPILKKTGNPTKFEEAKDMLIKLDSYRGTDHTILGPMF